VIWHYSAENFLNHPTYDVGTRITAAVFCNYVSMGRMRGEKLNLEKLKLRWLKNQFHRIQIILNVIER
jgi:hypothetical protein